MSDRALKCLVADIEESSSVELLSATVDQDVIDAAYRTLRQIERDATVRAAIAMGKAIVDAFYGGDLALWRSRGHKDASFRALAARFEQDGRSMSATSLFRAVAIFEIEQDHRVSEHDVLTVTHLRALIGHDDELTKKLIRHTLRNQWTADELLREAAELAPKRKNGRPRQAMFARTLRALDRQIHGSDDPFAGIGGIDEMEQAEAMELFVMANRVRKFGEEMGRLLQHRATTKSKPRKEDY